MSNVVVIETHHSSGLKSTREVAVGFNPKKIARSLYFSNTNFDDFYNKHQKIIDGSTLPEIKQFREHYKSELHQLNQTIKNKPLSVGMEKFLKGKRKFICRLLHFSKQKIKEINRFANN